MYSSFSLSIIFQHLKTSTNYLCIMLYIKKIKKIAKKIKYPAKTEFLLDLICCFFQGNQCLSIFTNINLASNKITMPAAATKSVVCVCNYKTDT